MTCINSGCYETASLVPLVSHKLSFIHIHNVKTFDQYEEGKARQLANVTLSMYQNRKGGANIINRSNLRKIDPVG